MKVIVAGYSKTGTKTMNAALKDLGYKVYDNTEHFVFHFEEWDQIFKGNGSEADFKRMYESVDAVTDHPANIYWQEIHKAFPDAKIILTIREENSWYKSLVSQCDEAYKDSVRFATGITTYLLPFMRRVHTMTNQFALDVTGRPMLRRGITLSYRVVPDPMVAKQLYRKHNASVLQNAPKDKLLIYNVKEGWEPLCKFLEKEIPDKPFPWKNIGGKAYVSEEHMRQFERQAMKEVFILLLVFFSLALTGYFYTKLYVWWQTTSTFLFGIFTWFFFL